MPTDDYGQGVTYLGYDETPDLKQLGENLAQGLAPLSNMRFASASTRDATLTAPVEGMEAWLEDVNLKTVYDGSGWVVMAAGSQVWTKPTLASGYSHNGNSNGDVRWRRVNLFGEPAVMWEGGFNASYSGGSPVNSGLILASALPSEARPGSRRTVTVACSAVSSSSLSVKIDFNTDGTVQVIAQSGVEPPWVSLNNVMYNL